MFEKFYIAEDRGEVYKETIRESKGVLYVNSSEDGLLTLNGGPGEINLTLTFEEYLEKLNLSKPTPKKILHALIDRGHLDENASVSDVPALDAILPEDWLMADFENGDYSNSPEYAAHCLVCGLVGARLRQSALDSLGILYTNGYGGGPGCGAELAYAEGEFCVPALQQVLLQHNLNYEVV